MIQNGISIWGPRASGKTSMLIGFWFAFNARGNWNLRPINEAARAFYLKVVDLFECLQDSEERYKCLYAPTIRDSYNTPLEFELFNTIRRLKFIISMIDFAGELSGQDGKDRQIACDKLANSGGIIWCLDPFDSEMNRYQVAIDIKVTLDFLLGNNGKVCTPIAFCLTKFDRLSKPLDSSHAARMIFRSAYGSEILKYITKTCSNFCFFSLSSYGYIKNGAFQWISNVESERNEAVIIKNLKKTTPFGMDILVAWLSSHFLDKDSIL